MINGKISKYCYARSHLTLYCSIVVDLRWWPLMYKIVSDMVNDNIRKEVLLQK